MDSIPVTIESSWNKSDGYCDIEIKNKKKQSCELKSPVTNTLSKTLRKHITPVAIEESLFAIPMKLKPFEKVHDGYCDQTTKQGLINLEKVQLVYECLWN